MVSERNRTKRIEMKKIRPLEIAGAINQARRGDVPEINRPQAQRENESMCTQATGGDPE